ncbi:hypothetical protein [Acinetobacter ihumii]|nr:hypothetical protein [Acinetobacter ihumii]
MHTSPLKQHQHSIASITNGLRQILGWSILYAGALILLAQQFNTLV